MPHPMLLLPLESRSETDLPEPPVFEDVLHSMSFDESSAVAKQGTSYALPNLELIRFYWKRVMVKTLGDKWEHLLETPATPVELETFKQLAGLDQAGKQIDATAYMKAIARYLGAIEMEPLVVDPWFDDEEWPNSHLLTVLRAKFLRRVITEKYAHVRTRLRGALARPWHETGSAAAMAKRMNPLGAPPFNA